MRDFDWLARILLPRRKVFHAFILVGSLVMVPGLMLALSPIDMESYNLDSPELDAREVIDKEYPNNEIVAGYAIVVRDQSLVGQTPHWNYGSEVAPFTGVGVGVEEPVGGILNLSVLREIEIKVQTVQEDPISEFYRPVVSDVTLVQYNGVLTLSSQFKTFMSGDSLLTRSSVSPFGQPLPPRTNWTDCGNLECLPFEDPELTQAHIDLAAQRMVEASDGVFLRWLSLDRAFMPADDGVLGPVGGTLNSDGEWENFTWEPGRWSASSTWLIVQFDRGAAEEAGWTFKWDEARAESGYEWDGLRLLTTPPQRDSEFCADSVESGDGPCSFEWSLMSLEYSMRESDDLTLTFAGGEGVNVEVNRGLQESVTLLLAMMFIVTILLWASLRRWSDVAIVSAGLGMSLLWMHGAIGWIGEFSAYLGYSLIERSQFSNLLPILILALGIDDSLHVLHRYKEERKSGKSCEESAHISLTRVGRAIMLTTVTTMVAFSANLISEVPALRSFGIEAALGVASAFLLTGLWSPLIRLDVDLWMEGRGKSTEEEEGTVHLVPSHWLSGLASKSAVFGPVVVILAVLMSALATPLMLSLEGDFKPEDFFDEESDFAVIVRIVNERFYSEGEPGEILVEGDVIDPRVYNAIKELRANMNIKGPDDPDRFTVDPTGNVDLGGYDRIVELSILSMANNITPFIEAGWDPTDPKGGVDCNKSGFGLPMPDDEDCLRFLVGFSSVNGVPESNSTPGLPPSVVALYIAPDRPLDPEKPWLGLDGSEPRYERMIMRFGLRQPEQFPIVEKAMAELDSDMSPFQNLSAGEMRERASLDAAMDDDDHPVSWAIATGQPVERYVAASSFQNEMQSTLTLGILFCVIALWWGFRPTRQEAMDRLDECRFSGGTWAFLSLAYAPAAISLTIWGIASLISTPTVALSLGLISFIGSVLWGYRSLTLALLTTAPIIIVVIWLYGLIAVLGYGLNMVTVAIATLSLGVGIDYVIHVIERYREERYFGKTQLQSIVAVGGASGLALVGSAASDVLGFLVISFSPMGFFSLFGTFSAAMIFFSLVASLIIACGMLGIMSYRTILSERKAVTT